MHVIRAHFRSLGRLPVTDLFGAIGVYVLWSPKADARPSYVGEGRILHRFATSHVKRFGRGTRGYAAILDEGTVLQNKRDAEILETVLLTVASDLDQTPGHNDIGGKTSGIAKLWSKGHNVVRVNVTGFHPLRWESRLQGTARVKLELGHDEDGQLVGLPTHPWRRR
jgi:hypothetical protein